MHDDILFDAFSMRYDCTYYKKRNRKRMVYFIIYCNTYLSWFNLMFLNKNYFIINNLVFFTGSYSNNVFPEPLSKEEEEKYVKLMMQGDKEARAKLIEHNLRLVAHIVKKFETSTNDVDDLIGIGTVGLIKGIDSFSPNKNVRLTTYIAKCAENAIYTCWKNY